MDYATALSQLYEKQKNFPAYLEWTIEEVMGFVQRIYPHNPPGLADTLFDGYKLLGPQTKERDFNNKLLKCAIESGILIKTELLKEYAEIVNHSVQSPKRKSRIFEFMHKLLGPTDFPGF